MPTGYTWPGRVTVLVSRPRMRFIKPRDCRWVSSRASSSSPPRMARNTRTIPISATRFKIAMMYRKLPPTPVPMMPRVWLAVLLPEVRAPTICAPAATRAAMPATIVEWPMANQNPTDFGRRPSPRSLRVVLSIAAM